MVAIQALATLFLSMMATVSASPIDGQHQPTKRCTATISSYNDIATAVSSKCTSVGKSEASFAKMETRLS
jgi:hypothetical protein